jgi:hypothetical protein
MTRLESIKTLVAKRKNFFFRLAGGRRASPSLRNEFATHANAQKTKRTKKEMGERLTEAFDSPVPLRGRVQLRATPDRMVFVELQDHRGKKKCQVHVRAEWTHAQMAEYLETGNHTDKEVRVFCRSLLRGSLSGPNPTHQIVAGDGSYAIWTATPLDGVASMAMPVTASSNSKRTVTSGGRGEDSGCKFRPGLLYVLKVGSLVLLTERVTRRGGYLHADTITFVLTAGHMRRCCNTPETLIVHMRRKATNADPTFARNFPRTVISMSHTRVFQKHLKLLALSNTPAIVSTTDTSVPVTHPSAVMPPMRELPVVVVHHMSDGQPVLSLWMLLFLLLAVVIAKWLVGNQRPSEVWASLRQND